MQKSPRMTSGTVLFAVVTLGAGLFLAGCGTQPAQEPKEEAHDDHGHQHAAEGSHDGYIIELGDGQYHAELLPDETGHGVAVNLLDAETKEPVASDQAEITLQIFEDGHFGDYLLEAVTADASQSGNSRFATVNEKLSDVLLGSDEVRGRLKVSIQGKPLTGIVERHAHEQSDHGDHDDHGDGDHDGVDHDDHGDHDDHDHDHDDGH